MFNFFTLVFPNSHLSPFSQILIVILICSHTHTDNSSGLLDAIIHLILAFGFLQTKKIIYWIFIYSRETYNYLLSQMYKTLTILRFFCLACQNKHKWLIRSNYIWYSSITIFALLLQNKKGLKQSTKIMNRSFMRAKEIGSRPEEQQSTDLPVQLS